MNKESFLIYTSYYKPISLLSDEQLGRLFRAIFLHNLGEDVSVDNDIQMAFEFFKNQFNIDEKKYREKIEKRAEAGKKGMEKRWGEKQQNITNDNKDNKHNNGLQNITNITNDNKDNYNVNVNDNVNDNKKEIYKEKVVGDKSPTHPKKNIESLEKRKNNFIETLTELRPIYGNEMVEDFISYWTEPNKSKTKMRFELEKTWDVARRLSTWCKNQSRFNHGNSMDNKIRRANNNITTNPEDYKCDKF